MVIKGSDKMINIGLTTRVIKNEIDQNIDKIPHSLIEKLDYFQVNPIIIPNISDISIYLKLCDGFIIPGGNTWNEADEKIIKYALENDLPVLGICAGMQAIGNIDTYKDFTVKVINNNHYVANKEYVHEVIIYDGILKDILNKDRIWVNSRHHDMVVKKDFFEVLAVSLDGVIEAINIPSYRCVLGLQWHPEDLKDKDTDKIFKYFIDKCRK